MEKYIASPNAEVIGIAMKNFFVSINKEQFDEIVQVELANAGIEEIEDDEWYSHQIILDIFKKIETETSSNNLVALGMAYVKTALFPPEIDSIQSGLILLAQTYHMNVRNTPEDEGYEGSVISDNEIQIIDKNPFPHDCVYGFIWGICQRFAAKDELFTVYRSYLDEKNPNNDGAIYNIKIEKK